MTAGWTVFAGLALAAASALGLFLFEEARRTLADAGRLIWSYGGTVLIGIGVAALIITYWRLRASKRETKYLQTQQSGLEAEVKALETEVARRGERLRDFRNKIIEINPADPLVELWKEVMIVRSGGDIEVEREVTITVRGPRPLHWWHFQFWGEPVSDEERRTVRPEVRLTRGGARLEQQLEWDGSNGWDVFADLPAPVEPNGDPLHLVLRYTLPHALPNFWGEGSERVRWNADHGKPIKRLEYLIQVHDVPADRKLSYNKIRLGHDPVITEEAGHWKIEGAEDDPPTAEWFGLMLDLTERE